MIFNLLKARRDDAEDTGTYADGVFELTASEINAKPQRLRGHTAHQRDYASDRTIAPVPAGFA